MNKKYSPEFKAKIVNAYLRGTTISGLRKNTACQELQSTVGLMQLRKKKKLGICQSICVYSMILRQDVNV